MNARNVKVAFTVLGIAVMVLLGAVIVTLTSLHSASSQLTTLRADEAKLAADGLTLATGEKQLAANQDALAQAQKTASSAVTAHLGICWDETTMSGNGAEWVTNVFVDSPQVISGVYQCQSGEIFASVVPQRIR